MLFIGIAVLLGAFIVGFIGLGAFPKISILELVFFFVIALSLFFAGITCIKISIDDTKRARQSEISH